MTLLKPGAYARDKVTGFEGTITALHQELGEPDQLVCQFRIESESRDGKSGESQWFDVSRVEAARNNKTATLEVKRPKDDLVLADSPKAEDGRPPIKSLIEMLMSMGIVKTVLIEGCNCPRCTVARDAMKAH